MHILKIPKLTPRFIIKRNDAVNAITVDPAGSDGIDSAGSKSLDSNYAFVEVVSDGNNYFIVSQGGTIG